MASIEKTTFLFVLVLQKKDKTYRKLSSVFINFSQIRRNLGRKPFSPNTKGYFNRKLCSIVMLLFGFL